MFCCVVNPRLKNEYNMVNICYIFAVFAHLEKLAKDIAKTAFLVTTEFWVHSNKDFIRIFFLRVS